MGEGKKKGKAPTYYCSVSQKMWCKVESAKSEGEKFALRYDCKGKARKVKIGGEDERVSFDEKEPKKSCGNEAGREGGEEMASKGTKREEGEAKEGKKEKKAKEGQKKEGGKEENKEKGKEGKSSEKKEGGKEEKKEE